ncbi:MAG TPA: carbohydrate binding domain-containing protein, partial [Cellulomonas sp.]|nr:carbohydrate binding domain-containing protein [Cellulomonas sp.]
YFGVTYENRVANVSQTFDWSAQDALSFWFLGTGSGKTFAYEIHNRNAAGTELAWAADVTDSSAGWRKVTTRFADFKAKSGVPAGQAFDPTVSTGFAVTLTGLGAGTFSFDDFALVERASLLDDFEHGITGDAATATGYFGWSSPAATVTLGERTVERDGDAANTTLGGTYQVPAGGWGGVSDNLLATQDWSSYRGVRFWWYASQADNPASPTAGNDVTFELKDGGPDAEHAESWTATFRDSWSTAGSRWKLVELPFSAFTLGANQPGSAETKNGVLDLTSTWGWSLTFPTGTAETAYALDDVQLYGTPRAAARVTVSTTQDVYLVDAGGTATVEVAVSAPGGAALETPVSVAYSLEGGTAVAGTDFTAASGTLTFPAGTASGSTRTFDVVTAPDRPADTARTLSVRLAGSGLTLPTAAPRVVINAHGLPYLDGSLPTSERVDDLLGRMSLAQKVGQMAQAERLGLSSPQQIATLGLGSVLSGGGSTPAGNTPDAWAAMIDGFQRQALSTSLQIPLLYGADAVHGHSNVKDATIYPHNIGLGATRDPALVERIGSETASETKTTGVNWAFAPCLCVSRDERW